MENISDIVLSLEEAKAALKCMRLSGLSEEESLETLDDITQRIRKVSSAKLVESIIENNLSETQRRFIKAYWYGRKNTAQIARENGVSQASVYKTLARANETIKSLMTPLVEYQRDLPGTQAVPLFISEIREICAAKNGAGASLGETLKNLRVSNAIPEQKMAQALKISLRELAEIEAGRRAPSLNAAMRYSELFGLEIKFKFTNGRGTYECRKL